MNNVSEKGSDFIQDLGHAVRKNPLPAALIGMGVLWLFAGSRPAESVGDFARSSGLDRIPDAAGYAADAARSTLRSGTDAVGEHVASAKMSKTVWLTLSIARPAMGESTPIRPPNT